jgi:Flp pilus assembly protein TadD
MLGTCHFGQGAFSEAARCYASILPASGRVEVHNNLGAAYLRLGELGLASTHLAAARSLARTDPAVSRNLAILRRLQGDERAAQTILEESLAEHPQEPLLNYLLADCLMAQGAQQRAASVLARAVAAGVDSEKLKNDDPAGWLELVTEWGAAR